MGREWITLMMKHDKMTKSGDKRNRVNEELDMVSMENVVLPMDLERHLSRSIHVINKFKLNEKRNLAVLSRLVESLNLSRNQMLKYFHHIRHVGISRLNMLLFDLTTLTDFWTLYESAPAYLANKL